MSSGTPRAYTNAIVSVGSSSRAVVRFACNSCGHELELANNNTRKHSSFYGAQARKRGWDTDGFAINRVFCPDCRKTPAFRSRREVELDSVVLPAMDPPTIEGTCEPVAEPVPQRTLPPPEKLMPRELTQEQRMQIRSLLDRHFDDKEGCYLLNEDGAPVNDQSIGSMVGVPWGEVTKIREAAYGKILVDPVLAPLRAQLEELATAIKNQAAMTAVRVVELDKRVAEMRRALDGYGRQQAKVS